MRRRAFANYNIPVAPRPSSSEEPLTINTTIQSDDNDNDNDSTGSLANQVAEAWGTGPIRRGTFGNINPLSNDIESEIPTDIPEEDSDYDNIKSKNTSIVESHDYLDTKHCINKNVLTLEDYTKEDEPIMIYTLTTQQKFETSFCISPEELIQFIIPDNLMTIYTSPQDYNNNGYGSKPTEKIIFKLNYTYITIGSIERLLREMKYNKTWYALPLYGGKRRRVGNIQGLFGISRNHGQIPGYVIYKLFTKEEIKRNINVKESISDYPTFFVNNVKLLKDIIGDISIDQFANTIINDLLFNVT